MKMNSKILWFFTLAAFAGSLFGSPGKGLLGNIRKNARSAAASNAPAAPVTGESGEAFASAAEEKTDEEAQVALKFRDASLDLVLKVYGRLVGRTVLKDPGVPNNVTITLESLAGQVLTEADQIEALRVALEMNGVHLEDYGDNFLRAVARKNARKEGIPLYMNPEDMNPDGRLRDSGNVVSVMIPFKNISAKDEAEKALEGFKTDSGLLQVFERTNSILVTDTQQNINRMLQIAQAIDIATPVLETVFVRQIKNASASEIQTALQKIVDDAMKYQEKDGKTQQTAANQKGSATPATPARSLLKSPAGANTPAAPATLESIVSSISDADRGMIRGRVLIVPDERSNKLIIVTSKANMDFFDKVIEALDVETTPDVKVEVIRLKYANAEDVSDMINDLIGNSASSKNSTSGSKNQNSKAGTSSNVTQNRTTPAKPQTPANQRSGESKAGELSKDNVTVLADKRINGLVVMARTEDMPTLHQIIESMDVRLSQVLIETVIIEISLTDGVESGMDWVNLKSGATTVNKTSSSGQTYYNYYDGKGNSLELADVGSSFTKTSSTGEETTWTRGSAVTEAARGVVNSVAAGGAYFLGGGAGGGKNAAYAIENVVTNLTANGLNYVFKSKKLNLGAILHAVKTDSHSKYIASPVVMTVDNKEATIEATEMRYLFKGYQYSGSTYSGSPVKDYEQKELGITVKVTPKINPNGTVMLTVEEEYSQQGNDQEVDGEMQATTVTRKMSADVVLENQQSVIFGGLTQTLNKESESGIPFLKDIPWIGKWLFSSTSQSETRSELLVFMTPYVLDDAEAAQAEALRRKNALSDARPWDDHGWSASALADPIAKKEVMRRLKEEAKKQDEDREAKLTAEKWKMDRARALEKMDAKERQFWIDAHREELDKEAKEKFDADMKEQADLKLLAEHIKAERMAKAEAKLEESEAAYKAESEHAKIEAAKSAEVEVVKPAELEAEEKQEEKAE